MGIRRIFSLLFGFVLLITTIVSAVNEFNNRIKYYDRDGTAHHYYFDMVFTDADGNKYTYNFDKAGYEYLYINSTEERLLADLCYLNADGYLCFDDDMSITARDESSCADIDGTLYYPARFSSFDKNGSIKYDFNSANFSYDRLGNAYTYDYVPYYDSDENKYMYCTNQTFTYKNLTTNESFDNEHCFVDKNGYFVYDSDGSFTEIENSKYDYLYEDKKGNLYFWASSITWDENKNMLDSTGNIINLKWKKELF